MFRDELELEHEQVCLNNIPLFEQTPLGSNEILTGENHSREFQNLNFFIYNLKGEC